MYSLCTHIDQILVRGALLQAADVQVRLGQLLRLLRGVARAHRVVCVGVAETRTQRAALRTGVGRAAGVGVAGGSRRRDSLAVLGKFQSEKEDRCHSVLGSGITGEQP